MTGSLLVTRKLKGDEGNASTFYPVVIIGAGMSGIAMACRLKQKLGFNQFKVFDRQSEIGVCAHLQTEEESLNSNRVLGGSIDILALPVTCMYNFHDHSISNPTQYPSSMKCEFNIAADLRASIHFHSRKIQDGPHSSLRARRF